MELTNDFIDPYSEHQVSCDFHQSIVNADDLDILASAGSFLHGLHNCLGRCVDVRHFVKHALPSENVSDYEFNLVHFRIDIF